MRCKTDGRRADVNVGLLAWSSTPPNQPIDEQVEHKRRAAQCDLCSACEALRVQKRHHVLLDEITLIRRQPAALAKHVLERRERADPACKFNSDAPGGGRNVQPCQTRP